MMTDRMILTLEQNGLQVSNQPIIILQLSQKATPMHGHAFAEIVVILDGECSHRTLRDKEKLQRGDVLLVPYGAVHAYEDTKNLHLVNLLFNPKHFMLLPDIHDLSCLGSFFARDGNGSVESILVQKLHLNDEELESTKVTLDKMAKIYADQKTAWQTSLLGYFLVFGALIERFTYSKGNKADRPPPESIFRVVSYMRENYHRNISLKTLVKYSNMSLSSFMRSFTESMGTAPMNYLSELRLSHSCLMLQNTNLNISEIATKSGYNDSNYFSRLFRKRLGVTPRKFRSLCKK